MTQRKRVLTSFISSVIDSNTLQTQIPDPVHSHGHFTPYESPLQQFHAYRYHPDFVSRVGHGYRSLTYSHNIDALKPLCPYDIGGRCNDPACDNQHFKSMHLSGAFGEQNVLHDFFITHPH